MVLKQLNINKQKKIFLHDPFIQSYTKVSYMDNEKWKC